MTTATIYHNPRCGTSRTTLALLIDQGVAVTVVEYLRTPPSRDELRRLYARAGIAPRDGLRRREEEARTLIAADPALDDDRVLDAMIADPIIIQRPIVETEKGVRLARPPETVLDIL